MKNPAASPALRALVLLIVTAAFVVTWSEDGRHQEQVLLARRAAAPAVVRQAAALPEEIPIDGLAMFAGEEPKGLVAPRIGRAR